MSDLTDIDELLSRFRARQVEMLDTFVEDLRAAMRAQPADDPFADINLLKPGEVVSTYGLSRSTVYRLCVENEFDGQNDGFAQWNETEERYRISAPRFAEFYRRYRPDDTS